MLPTVAVAAVLVHMLLLKSILYFKVHNSITYFHLIKFAKGFWHYTQFFIVAIKANFSQATCNVVLFISIQ